MSLDRQAMLPHSDMKPAIPSILISASLVAAVIFGVSLLRGLRAIHALSKLPTDEFITAGIALPRFICSLLLCLVPVALYAASFAFDRSAAWPWLGKLGMVVQVSYALLLVGSTLSLLRFALSIHRID